MDYLYDRTNPTSIELYAQLLKGKTFRQVLVDDHSSDKENKKNRGDLGQLIERHHFHYECNNDSNPDFEEAGVELKVTPFKENKNGSFSAKERLVLTKINYYEVVKEDFQNSHMWRKSRLILLVYYLYQKQIKNRYDYTIHFSKLYTPSREDIIIMQQDYLIISNKVKAGLAHELSESDTLYLGACTKGSSSKDLTNQPFSEIKAKPRAFSFKQSYMTYVLNSYIIPNKDTYKPLIEETELKHCSFEEIIKGKLKKYEGLYEKNIADELGVTIDINNKGYGAQLVYRMLGVKSNRVEEFIKAGILVKLIRFKKKKSDNQQFRVEDFKIIDFDKEAFDEDIIDQETGDPIGWEYSDLYDLLKNRKYLLVVFWEDEDGNSFFKGSQLWGMRDDDIAKVRDVWCRSKKIVRDGIKLELVKYGKGHRVNNNLPGMADNGIFHFRNHANKSYYVFEDGSTYGKGKLSDTDLLPSGERITKQAYWLNREYIEKQLDKQLIKEYKKKR